MDNRPDHPLNDSALEREVESLLDVDPSSEFVARVRTRIASEPIGHRWRAFPRAWSFEPLFAAGILGVVLLIVIPSWLRPEPPARVEQPAAATSPQQRVAAEPVRPEPAAASNVRARRRQPDRRPAGRQAPDASPFPEVLISDNERRAFALLLTTIEEGRLQPVPTPADQAASLEPPAIDIPELVIEPLPQIAALE